MENSIKSYLHIFDSAGTQASSLFIMHKKIRALETAIREGSILDIQGVLHHGGENSLHEYLRMNPIETVPLLSMAVDYARVYVVQNLLQSGFIVDNGGEMWYNVLRNMFPTAIFSSLFSQLKVQLNTNGQYTDSELNAAAWTCLESGHRPMSGRNSTYLIEHVAVHGTAAMLSETISSGPQVNVKNQRPGFVVFAIISELDMYACPSTAQMSIVIEKVRILLQAGIFTHQDPNDQSPSILDEAISSDVSKEGDLVRLILSTGMIGDINRVHVNRSEYHRELTPLLRAIYLTTFSSRIAKVSQLLKSGANSTQTVMGKCPLIIVLHEIGGISAFWDDPEESLVSTFLDNMTPEQVRASTTPEFSSLVYETVKQHRCTVENLLPSSLAKLLAKGADPNILDGPSGESPLFHLVRRSLKNNGVSDFDECDMATMRVLLQCDRVNIFQQNRSGETVIDLIKSRLHDWGMGREMYDFFAMPMQYEDARRGYAMSLHPDSRPFHNDRPSPFGGIGSDLMGMILDRKNFAVLPRWETVFPP